MGLRQRRLCTRPGIFCTPQLLMCPVPRPSAEGRTRPCTRLPFDIVINIASPTSSVSDAPRLGSTIMTTTPLRPTHTHDERPKSPLCPRTRSPARPPVPAMTSPRGHSTTTTTTTDGQASTSTPGRHTCVKLSQRSVYRSTHICKSSTPPNVSSQPHSSSRLQIQSEGGLTRTRYRGTHANLARLSSSLLHARPPAPVRACEQTLRFPPSPSCASDKGTYRRMSKPLPANPRTPCPNSQLDPNIPRQRRPPVRGTTRRRPAYSSRLRSPFRACRCAPRFR